MLRIVITAPELVGFPDRDMHACNCTRQWLYLEITVSIAKVIDYVQRLCVEITVSVAEVIVVCVQWLCVEITVSIAKVFVVYVPLSFSFLVIWNCHDFIYVYCTNLHCPCESHNAIFFMCVGDKLTIKSELNDPFPSYTPPTTFVSLSHPLLFELTICVLFLV